MKIGLIFTRTDDIKEEISIDLEGRDNNDDIMSVKKALLELGHVVKNFYVDEKFYETIKKQKNEVDLVFNMCYDGFFHQAKLEPHVPAMLDVIGIPYTGGDYKTIFLSTRKDLAKIMLLQNKLPTPKFQVFNSDKEEVDNTLNFPLIVKPLREDGSIGIKEESVVYNESELKRRVRIILRVYKQSALVEEFIDGREFNIGIVGAKEKEILPISEITFDELDEDLPKIVNYEAKWVEDSAYYKATKRVCPAKELTPELEQELIDLSIKTGELFGCRDYFRVDFRVDKNNKPFILEINQSPDISEDAGLVAMAQAKGYGYKELISKIVESASDRVPKAKKKVVVYLTPEKLEQEQK